MGKGAVSAVPSALWDDNGQVILQKEKDLSVEETKQKPQSITNEKSTIYPINNPFGLFTTLTQRKLTIILLTWQDQ